MEREADVIIIGGGIIGCATAYYLGKRGVRALLVENDDIATHQSGRNWGFARQQGRDPAEVPLMVESNRMWRELETELAQSVDWVQGGNLAVTDDPERLKLMESWLTTAKQYGVDTRLLTPDEVAAHIPQMSTRWLGGLFTPADGHAEPAKATNAYRRAAQELGAMVYTKTAAEKLLMHNGTAAGIVTDAGDEVRASKIVIAAGAWSSKLGRQIGLSIPQRWVRATVGRTAPAPAITQTGVWGPRVAFRQRPDGTINFAAGGSTDFDVTLDVFRHTRLFLPNYLKNRKLFRFNWGKPLVRSVVGMPPWSEARRHPFASDRDLEIPPNPAKVQKGLAELTTLFPVLKGIKLETSWAGYIDAVPDMIPIIEACKTPAGFYVATGFSGHGFGIGPVAGRIMSELIVDGRSSLPIEPFRLARFNEEKVQPRNVL